MPALTINTNNPRPNPDPNPNQSRSSSPNRPSISPLTPTEPAVSFPPPRQTFTHSQPDQIGVVPPAPEPISFDSNPDVIALKSAISVLQMQQRRATADIQSLSKVKDAAVGDPEAFIKDLLAGKVNAPQSNLAGAAADDDEDDEDDDEDDESNKKEASHPPSSKAAAEQPREWSSLPKAQDIVRCPPINWSQYAVVGESLDKLHAEQVASPSQGAPATVGANGAYEFKGEGKQERYPGVAAPYAPSKDKIDRKTRGKKP